MDISNVFSLVVLGLAFGAQVFLRSFCVRHIKKIFYFSVAGIFGIVSYWTYLQHKAWAHDPFGKHFLPPDQPISYFISYVGTRFFGSWLLALAAAMIIPYLAKLLNRRYGERFFENEEIPLMGLGIFLTGWPGFLFYIPLVLIVGVLYSLFSILHSKERAPLYFLWLPLAICAILAIHIFISQEVLRVFIL